MKKIITGTSATLFFLLALLLCYANYRLYDHPSSAMAFKGEAIATLRALKNPIHGSAAQQMQTMYLALEGLLCSKNTQNKKTYLFGVLPIIDVFMAWSQSTPSQHICEDQPIGLWRLVFQGISLLTLLAMVLLGNWMRKRLGS